MNQINFITTQDYAGHNQVNLQLAKAKNSYTSNQWLTFLQAKGYNLRIKKGSHGVTIASPFIKRSDIVIKDGKSTPVTRSFIPRFYTVFNLDQTESASAQV